MIDLEKFKLIVKLIYQIFTVFYVVYEWFYILIELCDSLNSKKVYFFLIIEE